MRRAAELTAPTPAGSPPGSSPAPRSDWTTLKRLLQAGNVDKLFNEGNPIYTKIRDDNPTRYLEGSKVKNSLLADGCVVEGTVENSVLFRGCQIKKGAVVRNCVLMQDTVVEENSSVEYVVTDKNVHITADKKLIGTDSFPVFVAKRHTV